MTDAAQSVQEDIAYVRALAEQGRAGPLLGGSIMVAAGGVFSAASLAEWAMAVGLAPAPPGWLEGIWFVALGVDAVATAALILRLRASKAARAAGPRINKAFGAIWNGVGLAIGACVFSFLLAQQALHDAAVFAGFPALVLSLYGAGWTASAVLSQRRWMWGVGLGSFAAALLTGLLTGQTSLLLAFAACLLLLIAAPGAVLMRQARAQA